MTRVPAPEPGSSKLVSLRQVSGAGLANVAYLGIQSLLFVALTPWMFKTLGAEVYGLWTILVAITGFANLANFGIGAGVTKYVSEFSVSHKAGTLISAVISFAFLFLLLSGILTGMLIFVLRHWLAGMMAHHSGSVGELSQALVIVSCGIAPIFIIQLPKGILFGLVYHKVVGGVDVAQSVAILCAALIIGLQGGGIVLLAISLVIINLAFLGIFLMIAFHATRSFALHFALNLDLAQKIFKYSWFAWISGLGSLLFSQADRVLVGMLLGPAAAGAYGICTGVAARLNSLAGAATQVLVPFASSYQASGRNAEIAKVFLHLLRIIGCLLATLGMVLIFWGKGILSIWISPEFAVAYGRVFELLILAYALFSMAAPGHYIAFGLGRPEIPAILTIGGSLLMFICMVILSPVWGLKGAAAANLAYAATILINFYASRHLGLKALSPVLKAVGPPIVVLFLPLMMIPLVKSESLSSIAIQLVALASLIWLGLNEGRMHFFLRSIRLTQTTP